MESVLKKLTSRGALAVIVIVVLSLLIFFIYAVYRDAEIIYSKDGLVKIIPRGSERIKQLENLLNNSVSKDEYQRLQGNYDLLENEYRIAQSRVNRLLSVAGVDLSNGEDAAIRKLEMLASRSKELERDLSVSLAVIRIEVMRGRTINTNAIVMNREMLGIYMDIQKFMRCIGIYNGDINGEQPDTCDAVKKFQGIYSLTCDGIIGEKTLAAMERAFEEAKSH